LNIIGYSMVKHHIPSFQERIPLYKYSCFIFLFSQDIFLVFYEIIASKKQKLAFSDQNTTNRLIIFISATKYVSFSPLKSSKNLI
jgi:hypothetical protein